MLYLLIYFKCLIFSLVVGLSITGVYPAVFAFHENLGISDEVAVQMYKTNPNDPQIMSWANAMQQKYNSNQFCFESPTVPADQAILDYVKRDCTSNISLIYDNCIHHNNTLLLCADSRIIEWVNNINRP